MHRPRIYDQLLNILILLGAYGLARVSANRNRKDVCGLSMHASDFPDIAGFSAIEATWTIPEVALGVEDSEKDTPFLWPGVALCCGDECSTRLFAGIWVSRRGYGIPNAVPPGGKDTYTAEPMFQLSPQFDKQTLYGEHKFRLNASDILWTRLELQSPTQAQLTFTKSERPNKNLTVTVDLSIAEKDGGTVLWATSSGNGIIHSWPFSAKSKDSFTSTMCGDSAWWTVSDNFDFGQDTERPAPLSRFSPVLIGNHGLQTANGEYFPADLGISGLPRYWNMVRENNGRNKTLCEARMFADSGMTMLHPPHDWGV